METALEAVGRRLATRFDGRVAPEVVERVMRETAAQWCEAPVQMYVPILVERYSRVRIVKMLRALDHDRQVA